MKEENFMKKHRIFLAVLLFGLCAPLAGMQQVASGYTSVLEDDRSYTDNIAKLQPYEPLMQISSLLTVPALYHLSYLPSISSFFSVQHQMARYGIEKEEKTSNDQSLMSDITQSLKCCYEFEQLSNAIFSDVQSILEELKFDIQSVYILKLNPKWRGHATTVVVTNACIFIDEDEWKTFDNPQLIAGFKKIVQEQQLEVINPVHSIKKYIMKRALAHYQNDTYRKKEASKLAIRATLGSIMAKTMPHVTDYVGLKSSGVITALSNRMTPLTNLCSKLPGFVQWTGSTAFTLMKWTGRQIGSMALSSAIGDQLRDVTVGNLDRTAEHQAVADETDDTKKLLVSYNASRAKWLQNNPLLKDEYAWRSRCIDSMVKA